MAHEQENAKPEGIYISSIAELVKALEALGEPEPTGGFARRYRCIRDCMGASVSEAEVLTANTIRFFRGHGNCNYQLKPSIYREQYLIENEDKIIRDAFTYCPESFSENETLFEKLVKLQHYGYATRLLDLTENALVALYFAVSSSQEKTAELLVMDIPETEIKYSDSDTVTILSAMSLQHNFELSSIDRELRAKAETLMENEIRNKKNEFSENKDFYSRDILESLRLSQITGTRVEVSIKKAWADEYPVWFQNNWNGVSSVQRLLHTIRNDKPTFQPIIQSEDLQRILCVRAKFNNPRITRQQGLFLLFGIGDDKSEQAKVNPLWIKSSEQRILIKPEDKEKILKELCTFGITKQYLFPELDSQAQEIMNRYKPEETKG